MSIVERALKKAQAKTPKPGAREALPGPPDARCRRTTPADSRENTRAHRGAAGTRISWWNDVDIDFKGLRAQGRLPPEGLAHQTEEEFRRIKWRVLNSITGREGAERAANNVVLVTSAIPGEGKTFNALNLALSMAREADLAVLLVDGDVAQPALTACLGLSMRPGLTDLVSDPLDVASGDVREQRRATAVMPAGARRDNSPELLASARIRAIIEELSRRMSPGRRDLRLTADSRHKRGAGAFALCRTSGDGCACRFD